MTRFARTTTSVIAAWALFGVLVSNVASAAPAVAPMPGVTPHEHGPSGAHDADVRPRASHGPARDDNSSGHSGIKFGQSRQHAEAREAGHRADATPEWGVAREPSRRAAEPTHAEPVAGAAADATTSAQRVNGAYDEPYWKDVEARLDKLQTATDVGERKQLLRTLAYDMNIVYRADRELHEKLNGGVGDGNCVLAATFGMISFATGHVIVPLSQDATHMNEDGSSGRLLFEYLQTLHITKGQRPFDTTLEQVGKSLRRDLAEGQMAMLISRNDASGHASVVVKLGGELYNINNQNAARPDNGIPNGELQTLGEWDARFRQKTGERNEPTETTRYNFITTSLRIGGGWKAPREVNSVYLQRAINKYLKGTRAATRAANAVRK